KCGDAGSDPCDADDYCDGLGKSCPDLVEPNTFMCRASTGDCDVDDYCDGVGKVCMDEFEPEFTPCDTGLDPCLSGDECDAFGVCQEGSDPKDDDNDGDVDDACGGTDCDDDDPDVAGIFTEGPVCDGSCYDGKDNNCVDGIDASDPGCQAANFICVDGPGSPVNVGNTGTITVRLDSSGEDENAIVCYTDDSRLLGPEATLLSNDFETDMSGFTTDSGVDVIRSNASQSPFTSGTGSWGVQICQTHWLMTNAIDTTGRARIQLRYAATASGGLDANEYYITEYTVDGINWYVLDLQGDNYRENWQWFTHILPPACEGQSSLQIRWRVNPSSWTDDCAYLDDVEILDLPDPTVSWTVLTNHFEASEGNSTADTCANIAGWTLIEFTSQGNNNNEICLRTAAQNPATQDGSNLQGLSVENNDPSWILDPDVDTQYVPSGSDLVAEFYMLDDGLPNSGYANAWYSPDGGTTWFRMNGVGADMAETYDWFRFVLEPAAIGVANVQIEFMIPTNADANSNQGFYLDDYDLVWYRASHDVIGAFTDQGDGTYTADISSDQVGTANVTCIYYGTSPPIMTDGTGDNSGSAPVEFQ
ncbi:MAG: hypothetical protein JXR96_09375, partial [Deltaproteobacteria bacterium]|nr:hypothetical protein [Deltaproteobacteria bacterium]